MTKFSKLWYIRDPSCRSFDHNHVSSFNMTTFNYTNGRWTSVRIGLTTAVGAKPKLPLLIWGKVRLFRFLVAVLCATLFLTRLFLPALDTSFSVVSTTTLRSQSSPSSSRKSPNGDAPRGGKVSEERFLIFSAYPLWERTRIEEFWMHE